jgi:hypothetical protein
MTSSSRSLSFRQLWYAQAVNVVDEVAPLRCRELRPVRASFMVPRLPPSAGPSSRTLGAQDYANGRRLR